MFTNKFEISKLIGFILLGPCFFLGSILYQEIARQYRYENTFDWPNESILAALVVIFSFVAVIGLLAKLNWSRYLITFILLSLTLLWFYIFFTEITPRNNREFPIAIGFTITVLTIGFGGIFLLFNKRIEMEFGVHKEEELDDILDL